MSATNTNWKKKYLDSLDSQEQQQQQFKQLLSLLVKAVTRISMIAEGQAPQLDKQLAGLRSMLREEGFSKRDLSTVVDALSSQVKSNEVLKAERSKQVLAAFQTMLDQLKALKPDQQTNQQLKQFSKMLKPRSASIQTYSALLKEFADIQQLALSTGEPPKPSPSLWQKMFASKAEAEPSVSEATNTAEHSEKTTATNHDDSDSTASNVASAADNQADQAPPESPHNPSHEPLQPSVLEGELLLSEQEADLSTSAQPSTGVVPQHSQPNENLNPEDEPPFSKFSEAICTILTELLKQIEPPPLARDNYRLAQQQIATGLNWYELVATLENISLVIISVIDLQQTEFQQFLEQLNQRLLNASQLADSSQTDQQASAAAGKALRESMREQVIAMQHSVAESDDLNQLKATVNNRLDEVLAAVDKHQSDEQQREQSLAEQLDALVVKVKEMEVASVDAEQQIEQHRQKALRDVLTQLPNREAYQQRLAEEHQRWQRYQRPLTLAICDIDFFKKINDNYGHQAGDKVLRIIAKSLKARLRKPDFIGRYGGEEFVILMPETDQQQALKVIEGIRQAIANCPFHFKEKPVSITLSFGICGFREGLSPEQVFAQADAALYKAKDRGRNCSVLVD